MRKLLLPTLLIPFAAWAQTGTTASRHSSDSLRCEVVHPADELPAGGSVRPLGEPSRPVNTNLGTQIFDNGYEYVYRLALCISPDYVNGSYGGDLAKVKAWVKEIGEYLNKIYQRDVGIRFEVITDDRLLLTQAPSLPIEDSHGTEIINGLIGSEAYDCGILIRPPHKGLDGRTTLNGAYQSFNKGNAMASSNMEVIAHELGHLFGASHTHHLDGSALCMEPGSGQSIMSYGAPRTAFALSSVMQIRNKLKGQCYYTGPDRNPNSIGGGTPGENANIPYVVNSPYTRPELDRRQLRKNYTVTEGTRFQFYVPATNATTSFTYGAQGFDEGVFNKLSNTLQPTYDLGPSSCVMFQPYYDEGYNFNEGKKDAILVKYSDAFNTGRYRFLLAAADHSRYDTEPVYLHIVKGKPFSLKTTLKMDQYQGKPLNLDWEPCTELYGTDSKVRILLSDDFGQTYKYVLDDNVPNTGKWSGFWPYLNIGKVAYRNFSNPIRGGVIKIEVKGEAAYTVTKEVPAELNPQLVYYGGFELSDRSTYVRFKENPAPYLEVSSLSEVPAMQELHAFHKNYPNQTTAVKGEERREGNVIRRRWTANLNSTSSTYTQLIVIRDESNLDAEGVKNHADRLKALATDLYNHAGELGYPKQELTAMKEFVTAFDRVFYKDGKVKASATDADINHLDETLLTLGKINDNDVVKPASRSYYRLRNFQDIFGHHNYYYLAQGADAQHYDRFTPQQEEASVWRCTEEQGKYTFYAADGRKMYIEQLINPGYRETLRLDRGYTWGAYTLVDETGACGQLSQNGQTFTRNINYQNDPVGYRTNRDKTLSTDFQLLPVDFVEASTETGKQPWNLLTEDRRLSLNDNFTDLHAAAPVKVQQLSYERSFTDTSWQPLYLPFTTEVSDWAEHCEVALIDGVSLNLNGNGNGARSGQATAEWVKLTQGKLLANQAYLIRAKKPGTFTFSFSNVTVESTAENSQKLNTDGAEATLKGNYGTIPAESMKQGVRYVLEEGALRKASTAHSAEVRSMRWYMNVMETAGGSVQWPETITLIEKGQGSIGTMTIATTEGYGTIYTDRSYVMPSGVTGYAVTAADATSGQLSLTPAYKSGETVPAHTPLLVKGEKRDYPLYAPSTEAAADVVRTAGNLLMGSATETQTVAPEGQSTVDYRFYKLYYSDQNQAYEKLLGFYWGTAEGGAFINKANKAYLALHTSMTVGTYGFTLPGNQQTGITTPSTLTAPLTVYTLTGVRLYPKSMTDLAPGVYIINGEKQIVK